MMADPQEALREQMREVARQVLRFQYATSDEVIAGALADAVLPVVQAHTQALDVEVRDNQMRWLKAQRDQAAVEIDLASLRDAVSRLADEFEAKPSGFDPHKKLTDESAGYWRGRETTFRDAARRLRSLLPQEG